MSDINEGYFHYLQGSDGEVIPVSKMHDLLNKTNTILEKAIS